MQEYNKNLEIINNILEDSGILRYNAIKNRFKNESMDSPTLLYFYRSINPKEVEDSSAIFLYRTNLQKLRRKIEERRIRVVERHIGERETREVQEFNTVTNQEVVLAVSPNGETTPHRINTPVVNNTKIDMLNTLNDFKYSNVYGESHVYRNKKKYSADLFLKGSILTSEITDKKKGIKSTICVDITLSKMYLIFKQPKPFISCLRKPNQTVCIEKEVDIVNVNVIDKKTTEIIMKNTNTSIFTKQYTSALIFAIKDINNETTEYEVRTSDELVRWVLLFKTRMYTVDRWSKDELLETIRR